MRDPSERLLRKFVEGDVEVVQHVIHFILAPAGIGVQRPGTDPLAELIETLEMPDFGALKVVMTGETMMLKQVLTALEIQGSDRRCVEKERCDETAEQKTKTGRGF